MIPVGTEMFFMQMCADPALAEHANPIADCLDALDREGDGLPDAAGQFAVLTLDYLSSRARCPRKD